jgi:hypothetical protein
VERTFKISLYRFNVEKYILLLICQVQWFAGLSRELKYTHYKMYCFFLLDKSVIFLQMLPKKNFIENCRIRLFLLWERTFKISLYRFNVEKYILLLISPYVKHILLFNNNLVTMLSASFGICSIIFKF